MNLNFRRDEFNRRLAEFLPDKHIQERLLAFLSVAIASADDDLIEKALIKARTFDVTYSQLYEIVLQSYLFLGFPRMLSAAMILDETVRRPRESESYVRLADGNLELWRKRGTELCRRIYVAAYEPLRDRVQPAAPEIFDWMVTEGYGKVLSRPGLPIITRELSIVAFLMAENRPRQLHSHMRGVLNVGGSCDLLRQTVDDIGPSVGDGYDTALSIMPRLGRPECDA